MMAMARSSIGEAGQLNRDRVAKFGARQPGHLGCAFRLSKRGERNARRAFSAPITVASLQNQTGPSSGGMRAGLRGVRLPLGVPSGDEADMSETNGRSQRHNSVACGSWGENMIESGWEISLEECDVEPHPNHRSFRLRASRCDTQLSAMRQYAG